MNLIPFPPPPRLPLSFLSILSSRTEIELAWLVVGFLFLQKMGN